MSEETPAQLRDALEAAEKAAKKAMDRAMQAESELRTVKARETFRDANLDPNLSELYTALNHEGDVTVEAAQAFAEQWGIGAAPVEPEPAPAPAAVPAPEPEGLSHIGRAGSLGGGGAQPPVDTATLTTSEFVKLLSSDRAAANKALAEGRVKMRSDNPFNRDPEAAFSAARFGGEGSDE